MPTMATRSTSRVRTHAVANGYRSGLEERIGKELAAKGINVTFEGHKVFYTPPSKLRSYTPDFVFPNGVIVESKGRFLTEDRQKHKIIKEEHPELDIRFLFSRSKTVLSKGSKTTYADWCRKYGFQFADVSIPTEWSAEAPCLIRLKAIERASSKPITKT